MKMIYLACAYSVPGILGKIIMRKRFKKITKLAARIMEKGINVFSPITHSHFLKACNGGN